MINYKMALFLSTLILFHFFQPASASTYKNPVIDTIKRADPACIYYNGKYYMYPTGDSKSYKVYTSTNLMTWSEGKKIFSGTEKVWAPDVFWNKNGDGKFYLYYTEEDGIGVAVSDQPDQRFKRITKLAHRAIDAHMYEDTKDGNLYLYYRNLRTKEIEVQPMADVTTKNGNPIPVLQITEPWEKTVIEAPYMIKNRGTYYLIYSGGFATSRLYSVGYATSRSPRGPFTKYEKNPIISTQNDNVFGPGHGDVVKDKGGNMWHVYHQKNGSIPGFDRKICIDPLWIDSNKVLHGASTWGTVETGPDMTGCLDPNDWPESEKFSENRAPEGIDDNKVTTENASRKIDVLANDSDPDGDSFFISSFTQGSNGNVTDNGDETLTYTPNLGFTGIDYFTYKISDNDKYDTVIVTVTVNSITPRNDQVLHLKFAKNGGQTAFDSSGKNNHGTLSGINFSNESRIAGPSETGTALTFDGTDDYINMGNHSDWNLTETDHSIALWFKHGSQKGHTRWLTRETGGKPGAGYVLKTQSDGILRFLTRTDSGNYGRVTSPKPLDDDGWHHAAVVVDTNTKSVDLYIDGIAVDSDTYTGNLIDYPENELIIGGRSSQYFSKGSIDDVRIYHKALSPAEIQQLLTHIQQPCDDL